MRILKLSFLFLLLFLNSCSDSSQYYTVKKSDITESVYASGIVKSVDQHTVFSTVSGVLQRINAEAGSEVRNGQVLFEIESDKAMLNTQNTELAYELSREKNRFTQDKIAELELSVQAAYEKYLLDKSVYERTRNIKEYGGVSEVDFERLGLNVNSSKLNYESLKKRLAQLKLQLKNEEASKELNYKISKKAQSDYSIRSAFDGELYDVYVEVGTMITPQVPMAVIGKKNAFFIELEVDENDMVKVVLGQQVLITLDSYKNQVFEAVVDKIYPIMNDRSRTFKIEARFLKLPTKLYPNLTAEANIVIQTKKQTIVIPKEYLSDNEYVWIDSDEKRKVKTGLSDYNYIEILDGLKEGEKIYLKEK